MSCQQTSFYNGAFIKCFLGSRAIFQYGERVVGKVSKAGHIRVYIHAADTLPFTTENLLILVHFYVKCIMCHLLSAATYYCVVCKLAAVR